MTAAARELSGAVSALRFGEPVTHVYNPLDYAWGAHEQYLNLAATGKKKVVFLGMNPGPFGMAQTGVPFGEIAAVRDWIGIDAPISKPKNEHPKRPVDGLACNRSEVSGRRLWGLFAERFDSAEVFFTDHFIANHCPLVFMDLWKFVMLTCAARLKFWSLNGWLPWAALLKSGLRWLWVA